MGIRDLFQNLFRRRAPITEETPAYTFAVAEQAAEWVIRMHLPDVTIEERREYVRWLKASRVHVAEAIRALGALDMLAKSGPSIAKAFEEIEKSAKQTLIQAAIVTPIGETSDGVLIQAVSLPWLELVAAFERDPRLIHEIHWRKWEEIVAAAYERQGFEVVLTPHSHDRGRDVIAVHREIGTIRIFDQVKAYAPGHLVTANDVRAILGVLTAEPNVSKGFITTTSTFAPGIYKDSNLTSLMPYRLELRPRDALITWLAAIKNADPRVLLPGIDEPGSGPSRESSWR